MYTTHTVTLLYLSFYEPDTAFKCANEVLYLMSLPLLDSLFRNPVTGMMKDDIIMHADNGSSFNNLVVILLVRLLKFHA